MTIPTQSAMNRVVLDNHKDGEFFTRKEASERARDWLKLTPEEINQKTSSGAPVYKSRVSWAVSWLKSAGYLDNPQRGIFQISEAGRAVLSITETDAFVRKMREDKAEREETKDRETDQAEELSLDISPEEMITKGYISLHEQLADDLMAAIMETPGREGDYFFEKVVTDLLEHMGYGEGRVTQSSNDGGIDGIITTDALGFDPIYIQAKRYSKDNKVGAPAIRDFAGSLGTITRGVFITTSSFVSGAVEVAKNYPYGQIILIDGKKLVDLMIQFNLGVSTETTIELKRLDTDYFDRED